VPPPEDKIRRAPLPAPGLSRHLTLVARRGERGSIPAKVASLACRVIEARLRPELARLMPFAEKRVVIG